MLLARMLAASVALPLAMLGAGPALSATKAPAPRARLLPSLCRPPEVPLFQCPVGAKQVAICAASAAPRAAVQYRFGAPGKVELAYPTAPGAAPLRWAQTGYSGGGEMQVSFANGGVTYVVYSRMVRTGFGKDGLNYPKDELGVAAIRGGKTLSDARCRFAEMQGGNSGWIDEQRTMQLLKPGEFIYVD